MPKLPPFEEWTPPWKSDDEFDAEKAKKLIYGLSTDKEKLKEEKQALTTDLVAVQDKVKAFETKDESEVERLKRELAEAKERKAEDGPTEAEVLRLRVALNKGLTEKQVKRLHGTTLEELEADADDYLRDIGGKTSDDDGDDDGEDRLDSRGTPRVNLRTSQGNPATQKPGMSVDDVLDAAGASPGF